MRFSLTFSLDNSAFDGGDNGVDETCRILHALADRIDGFGAIGLEPGGRVYDVSGNAIGEWEVTDTDSE